MTSQEKPWGILQPIIPEFYVKSLTKKSLFVGRQQTDYSLCTQAIGSTNLLASFSKLHFIIHRVDNKEEDDLSYTVYITDHSRHGTFVNGVKLTHQLPVVLNSQSTISLCQAKIEVLHFIDFQVDDIVLPPPINKIYRSGLMVGKGGFGEVYFSYNLSTNLICATKRVRRDRSTRFFLKSKSHLQIEDDKLVEARIIKDVCHPNIVGVYDVIIDREYFYIVLEYASGGDLLGRINNVTSHDWNEQKAQFYFIQAALATNHLHSLGITHRDIKLQNMLLMDHRSFTQLKLSDFGLSKILNDEVSYMKTLVGTPHYLAPELIKALVNTSQDCHYHSKVDLWALGVVLFMLLVRRYPFYAENRDLLYSKILQRSYSFRQDLWGGVSELAKNVVTKLLQPEEERIDSFSLLQQPWVKNEEMVKFISEMPTGREQVPNCKWQILQ